MDALLSLVMVVVALVSVFTRSAKVREKARARGGLSAPNAPPVGDPVIRPVDVDLPGQATVPIRWNESPPPAEQTQSQPIREQTNAHRRETVRPEWMDTGPARKTQTVDIPGLDLRLDADTLVKGVIFSEILNRRTPRRMQ